jgi:hypothetical protein
VITKIIANKEGKKEEKSGLRGEKNGEPGSGIANNNQQQV